MKLNELFVSHKQVDPVSFEPDKPELPKNIYFNLNRAQKAVSTPETTEEDMETWNTEQQGYDWNAGYKSTYEQTKPEIKTDKSKEIIIPYKEEMKPTQTSKTLLDYIKNKERFVSTVYKDTGGIPTIGYGFTDPEIIKKGRLTEQEASDLLEKDIEQRRNKLRSQIKSWDKLNQNQQDALTSYGFNVGVENWARTQPKLLAALNEERFNEAAKYMDAVKDKVGNTLRGLQIRRQEEQEWFNRKMV